MTDPLTEVFNYFLNRENWPLIISLLSLAVSIIGWSVTYENQQKITEQQNLDANERERKKLLSQRKLSQLNEVRQWFDQCVTLNEKRDSLNFRDPKIEGYRKDVPEDSDEQYYFTDEEIKDKLDLINFEINSFYKASEHISFTARLLDPIEYEKLSDTSHYTFEKPNQSVAHLEWLIRKMKEVLDPERDRHDPSTGRYPFNCVSGIYEIAVFRIEKLCFYYTDLNH